MNPSPALVRRTFDLVPGFLVLVRVAYFPALLLLLSAALTHLFDGPSVFKGRTSPPTELLVDCIRFQIVLVFDRTAPVRYSPLMFLGTVSDLRPAHGQVV